MPLCGVRTIWRRCPSIFLLSLRKSVIHQSGVSLWQHSQSAGWKVRDVSEWKVPLVRHVLRPESHRVDSPRSDRLLASGAATDSKRLYLYLHETSVLVAHPAVDSVRCIGDRHGVREGPHKADCHRFRLAVGRIALRGVGGWHSIAANA